MEGRRLSGARRALAAAGLPALAGCSAGDLLNVAAPVADTRATRDIACGEGERRRLDVYRPPADAARPAPVVVFFYGGRWSRGERADHAFVGAMLAAHGLVVVIPDYRLYPAVRFPAFIEANAPVATDVAAEP